jgi:DNA repair protein RadD
MHNKLPEKDIRIDSIDKAIAYKKRFRLPMFIIARKQKHFWKIREKIFR